MMKPYSQCRQRIALTSERVIFIYFWYSISLILLYFDTCANQLLSTFRLKYSNTYVHIDVVVKYSEITSMHEDVKFKFISFLCVTA
jgi:hypothetical protein